MTRNPFKYTGPLDPVKNEIVLVPRNDDLNRVIEGIKEGEYWGIFGLRQIGKTTFLRQIKNTYKNAHHVYIDFEVSPKKEENFYHWLMEEFTKFSSQPDLVQNINMKFKNYAPDFMFTKFLEEFKPQKYQKIILLFDEIEGIPFLEKFLRIWRKVYIDRDEQKQFNLYSVIITGSAELVGLTKGKTSPFNIAKHLYLQDFSIDESQRLINESFTKSNIKIDPDAKYNLVNLISGHPQMLQHACSKLFKIAVQENRIILEKDIDNVINLLLNENLTIETLREDLRENRRLKRLIKDIFKGKKKKFIPYREFSIKGAGPIVEDEKHFCTLRNMVYKKFLIDYLDISSIPIEDEELAHIENDSSTRYDIIKKIGEGGMGIVYKAKDTVLDRTVAIKKLSGRITKNTDNVKKFYREASTTAKLRHQNIVRIYDIRQIKNDHFIIMEFIEGVNYEKIIRLEKKLKLQEIVMVAESLFAALAFFHSKGIIHRDLKPQNIMRDRENEIKILDFGIAALYMDESLKKEESDYIIASPFYMSPEQIKGEKMDHRSDIYSAGVTLFQLTTGQVPFEGKNQNETLWKHLKEPVPSIRALRPDVPFELAEIIEKCMQKEKKDRYQSAREVLEQFKAVAAILEGQNLKGEQNNASHSSQTVPIPGNIKKQLEAASSSQTQKTGEKVNNEKKQNFIPNQQKKIVKKKFKK